MKIIAKKIGKVFLWLLACITACIFLACILLTVPAIQTNIAQRAAAFLSEKLHTEVSIAKLRIDFNLNIQLEDIRLNDLHGNNLISAKKGSLSFPSFNTGTANVEIRNIILDEADVILRRYESDTALNLQFFIDFVRPSKKTETIVDLQKIQLRNSRFQLRNDTSAKEDKEGVWNYSNMIIEDINLQLGQLLIIGDSLNFYIDKLSARERSGFEVEELSGHLIVCRSGIHCLDAKVLTGNKSKLSLDFRFDYTDYSDFKNFNDRIFFNTDLHSGLLNMNDLVYFVPSFKGMNNTVWLTASVNGALSDFKIRDMQLTYGQATEVNGDITLNGLPNIEETFIDFTVDNLKTNVTDVASFSLPNNKSIPVPDMVKKLQWIQTKGHFLGMYDNFFADASFTTATGNISCELMLNNRFSPIAYDGKFRTNNLDLGKIFNREDLGTLSMLGHIKGEGITVEDLNFQLQSTISNIVYKNEAVKDIYLSGNFLSKQFDGKINCDDEDFNLDFNGLIDFNQQEPHYDFEAAIHALNVSKFQFFRPDSNVILSAVVKMDLNGQDPEHLHGTLSMDSVIYQEQNTLYPIPDLALTVKQKEYPYKDIQLTSDILNASISGRFNYIQAFKAIQKNLHDRLSNIVPPPTAPDTTQEIFNQQFELSVHLKKSVPLLHHFVPYVDVGKGFTANISVDQSKKTGSISFETPQLDINHKYRLTDLSVINQQSARMFNLGINCNSFYTKTTDSIAEIQDFDLQAVITDNVIDFLATAAGNTTNKIQDILIEGSVRFSDRTTQGIEFILNNGSVLWDKELFLLDTANYVYLAKDSLYIRKFGLYAQSGKSVLVKSGVTERAENGIFFDFNKIDLELFNVFLNQYQVSLKGITTGKGALVRNAFGYALGSALEVEDFYFNDVPMGFFQGRTFWDNIEKKLFVRASLFDDKQNQRNPLLTIGGYFDPQRRYIDLTGNTDSLNIKVLEPYLRSFASTVEGFGSGAITFKGPVSNPELKGNMVIKKAVLGIDFLKTNYFIEQGTIHFTDTGFIFDNIPFTDAYHGKGSVNGMVTHKYLRNFGVDLRINAVNLSVLHTERKDNGLFYGKAFATGNASIFGMVNNTISVNANIVTNHSTDITLSLDWNTTAAESKFITFVTPEMREKKDTAASKEPQNATGMLVNLNITATPDATVRVLLDPSIGGTIIGKGNGTLELTLDESNDFSLYGNYMLTGGEFNLAYYDILTRTFKLESGGVISWNGNPTEGIMNIRAIQAAKVPINNLYTDEEARKVRPIAVNNILTLSGKLLNPEFSFTFTLPDADEITKSKVYSSIDTTDREAMILQMMYVLFMGKFAISSDNQEGGNTVNLDLGYSISEFLSYQLNRFISGSVSQNLDVRVAYRPGEDMSENEYSVDIGGSFLDNKLTVTTSVGILEQQDLNAQDRFLGDITVDYKLIPDGSLRIKAFNITNQQDVLQSAASASSKYSQGIGLSFSKDFD
ncbi:MAG: translocation/assembly module TamB, partial [Bacteroidales bacterium]|nr:translocation/assembly module TamB [Bacteroidales bacterium]